jgi:hypothetical protein
LLIVFKMTPDHRTGFMAAVARVARGRAGRFSDPPWPMTRRGAGRQSLQKPER